MLTLVCITDESISMIDSFKVLETHISKNIKWKTKKNTDHTSKKTHKRLLYLWRLSFSRKNQCIINRTSKIIGQPLAFLELLHCERTLHRACKSPQQPIHPASCTFQLLLSGMSYNCIQRKPLKRYFPPDYLLACIVNLYT